MAYTPVRPGFLSTYAINYANVGVDTLINKTIKFVANNHLHFSSTNTTPNSIVADTITWVISQLLPDSSKNILLYLAADVIPQLNLNDTVRCSVFIDSIGDVNSNDNFSSTLQTVIGSYDPNDKQENFGGIMLLSDATLGKYLSYTIRFQNTGTDTAFNIKVKDTLSTLLDATSFEMIQASHNYTVAIKDGKYITWQFNNINLLDSVNNEPLSHGYISYRIKPKLPLLIGDEIKNAAAIYFDYNPPIFTNVNKTKIKGTPTIAFWTGAVSTAWENSLNWSNGKVPDMNTDITIPTNATRYPEISSIASCYKITVMPTATILVKVGFKLIVFAKN